MIQMSLFTFDDSNTFRVALNSSKLTPQAGEIKDVKQLNLGQSVLQESGKKDEKSNGREVHT